MSAPAAGDDAAGEAAAPRRSIVIPCYNERQRLPGTLESVRAYLDARADVPAEVVVADDGSTDDTVAWVREQAAADPRVRLVELGRNQGKGAAVRAGVLAARGEHVLFMDADGATPVGEADKVWPLLESGAATVVVGSRRHDEATVEAGQGPLRHLASQLYGLLTRLLVLRGVPDTQCGFKAFTRDAAQALFPALGTDSAIFDIELFVLAARRGDRVAEVPVSWTHDDDSRITYDARRTVAIFLELLKLKWRHRIGWPLRVASAG